MNVVTLFNLVLKKTAIDWDAVNANCAFIGLPLANSYLVNLMPPVYLDKVFGGVPLLVIQKEIMWNNRNNRNKRNNVGFFLM